MQFSAKGVYSDNSIKDLTDSVIWSSATQSVATISNIPGSIGSAVAVALGSSIISAATGSITASTTLTVGGCQTIDDILLDTGSYGLRVFKQALNGFVLPQVLVNSGSLAECVQYADGSSDWGPIVSADIILGGEPPITVPVQVIDQTFGTPPSSCNGPLADIKPDQTPGAGFNGILGVGLFAEDCGSVCANSSGNSMYYVCNGSSCSGTTVALNQQVQNPVALLPIDNNGMILQLPGISSQGTQSVAGSLVLGIHSAASVTMYPANPTSSIPFIQTSFNTNTYSSFIDSGSNGIFFPSTIPMCSSGVGVGWFCPSSTQSLQATNLGYAGSPVSPPVNFSIESATTLFNSGNNVFNDLGADSLGNEFDWGLPFFFGRDVYFGIEGKSSPLGTGPYWAY